MLVAINKSADQQYFIDLQNSFIKTATDLGADAKKFDAKLDPNLGVSLVNDAISAGARGVIRRTSSLDQLRECLLSVARGNVWLEETGAFATLSRPSRKSPPRLTSRERDILGGVLRGWKNREIAQFLDITPGTVKVHLLHLYEKTGMRSRFDLAAHGGKLLIATGKD